MTEQAKIIPRFAPFSLSRLWVIYVADILPFSELLRCHSQSTKPEFSTALFQRNGTRLESSHLSDLKAGFSRLLGCTYIGLRDYRQISTILDKEFIRPNNRVRDSEEAHSYMRSMMSGHSPQTEMANYAVGSELFHSATETTLTAMKTISRGFHRLYDLDRDYVDHTATPSSPRLNAVRRRMGGIELLAQKTEEQKRAFDAQHGGDTSLADVNISRPSKHVKHNPGPQCDTGGSLSAPLSSDTTILDKSSRGLSGGPVADWGASIQQSLKSLLRSEDAVWRDGQLDAVTAIVQGTASEIVIRLPASVGKSIVIALAASQVPQQIILVLLPFIAILEDIHTRMVNLGLSVERWNSNNFKEAQIVLASLDQITDTSLRPWIQSVLSDGRMMGIVFDKCQTLLHDTWRADVQNLLDWLSLPSARNTKRILMSGSLAVTELAGLRQLINPASEIQLVTRPLVRPNIAIHVIPDATGELTRRIIDSQCSRCEGAKAMFFVMKMDEDIVKPLLAMTNTLQPVLYHSKMLLQDRTSAMTRFRSGSSRLMISTTAASSGIDIPDLATVIVWRTAYTLSDLVQQFYRACRTGEYRQVYLAVDPDRPHHHKALGLDRLVSSEGCRLLTLADLLGETGGPCPPANPCDRCKRPTMTSYLATNTDQYQVVSTPNKTIPRSTDPTIPITPRTPYPDITLSPSPSISATRYMPTYIPDSLHGSSSNTLSAPQFSSITLSDSASSQYLSSPISARHTSYRDNPDTATERFVFIWRQFLSLWLRSGYPCMLCLLRHRPCDLGTSDPHGPTPSGFGLCTQGRCELAEIYTVSSFGGMTGKLRAAKAVQTRAGSFICYRCLAYLKCHRGNCDGSDRIVPLLLAASTIPDYAHVFQEKGIEVPLRSNWDAEFINSTIGAFGSLQKTVYLEIIIGIIDRCMGDQRSDTQG